MGHARATWARIRGMWRRGLNLLTAGSLAIGVGAAPAATLGVATSAGVAGCIRDPDCHPSYVVSHRAKGFGPPEDSREAIRAAIAAGVAVIEVDIRRSSDGRLFVLHDPRLERTTTMSGRVSDFTAAELGRALLANGEALPAFEEIYALSRGKVVLDLRFHVDAIEQMATWIADHGSFDDVIFFAICDDFAVTAARVRKAYPAMMVMAKAQDWEGAEKVIALFGRPPEILHPDRIDPEFDRRLRSNGIKTFRNFLDLEQAGAEGLANEVSFFRGEIDFLQSDRPVPLLQKLALRGIQRHPGN